MEEIEHGSTRLSKSSSSKTNRSKSHSTKSVLQKQIIPGFEKRLRTFIDWSSLQELFNEHWTNYENNKYLKLTFSDALNSKIKTSFFYNFMGDFHCKIKIENYVELMELTLWDLDKFGSDEDVFENSKSNNITDSVQNIIKKAVKEKNKLDSDWLKNHAQLLRIVNYQVTIVDTALKQFKGVEYLNLSLNFLTNVKGGRLPRQLQMLELQGNFISNVASIARNTPKKLSYLGLSRNQISDENHDLISLKNTHLTIIDLSDNDISDLRGILSVLVNIKTLTALSLDGNPCSFCQAYKDIVVSYFPGLIYLDGIELQEDDKTSKMDVVQLTENVNIFTSGVFTFSCYRVMALPAPPQDKTTTKMYYLEIITPVLDGVLTEFIKYNDLSFMQLPQNKLLKTSTEKNKSDGLMTQLSDEARTGEFNDDFATNSVKETEIDVVKNSEASVIHPLMSPSGELEEIYNKSRTKTQKHPWKNLMEFNVPSVEIPCEDLSLLRDTFRSKVTVNLMSESIRTADLKTPSKKKGINQKDSKITLEDSQSVPDETLKEKICSFQCQLHSPTWNNSSLDFEWSESLNNQDAQIRDGLMDRKYPDKTHHAKGAKLKTNVESVENLEFPEELTCHVSFGVLRTKYTNNTLSI